MSKRQPITHELKCHPEPFQAVLDGTKRFEWRKADRDYQVGDTLKLREWDQAWRTHLDMSIGYTGRECTRTVTYIIREGFGIPEGYCIMGLSAPHQGKDLTDQEIDLRTYAYMHQHLHAGMRKEQAAAMSVGYHQGLTCARDHGYLRTSPGLTVDEVMKVLMPHYLREKTMDAIRSSLEEKTKA